MGKMGLLKKLVFENRYRWLRHLLLGTAYFIVISILDNIDKKNHPIGAKVYLFFFPILWGYACVIIYYLIPAFLLKRRYFPFIGLYFCWCSIGLVAINIDVVYIFARFLGNPTPQHFNPREFFTQTFTLDRFLGLNFFPFICVFIKLFKLWYIEQQQKHAIEKEKLNAQLELLKAQLHPHFLFNTLNNLYSLVYEKSDKAPKMLMRLADLLSYVLYECKADEVLLSREMDFIKDYILLEKERYLERLDVSLNFSGDIRDRTIAPMLFQPFIENAFKHGTSEQLGKVWMSIDLSVKQSQLYFKVINSCDKHHLGAVQKGIGIDNIRKRLDLLYPGRFELQYGLEDDVYIVSLSLELITPVKGHPVFEGISALKQAQ